MKNPAQKPTLAIVVGSNRRDSINRKLAGAMSALAEPKFEVKFVDIAGLPIFGEFESALPTEVARFKDDIEGADGVLIVTPEHNRSIPAALKNAIDWGGPAAGQNVWAGKPVLLTGTSPGSIGTALAQQHLRQILGSFLGALVLGGEAYITFKPDLIDANGRIAEDGTQKFLRSFIDQFATIVGRLRRTSERAAA
jgi:chromate reductase